MNINWGHLYDQLRSRRIFAFIMKDVHMSSKYCEVNGYGDGMALPIISNKL